MVGSRGSLESVEPSRQEVVGAGKDGTSVRLAEFQCTQTACWSWMVGTAAHSLRPNLRVTSDIGWWMAPVCLVRGPVGQSLSTETALASGHCRQHLGVSGQQDKPTTFTDNP